MSEYTETTFIAIGYEIKNTNDDINYIKNMANSCGIKMKKWVLVYQISDKHYKYPKYILDINKKYGCNISIVYNSSLYDDGSFCSSYLSICNLNAVLDTELVAPWLLSKEIENGCLKFLKEIGQTTVDSRMKIFSISNIDR